MMQIRETIPSDCESILRIVAYGGVFHPAEAEVVRELLDYYFRKTEQDEYLFLTAADGERVLGFACYGRVALTKYNYELSWIATAKDALRGGVGRALLDEVEQRSRRRGGHYINLETESTSGYVAARAFYARQGYQIVAQIADYYDEGSDMLMYRKALVG